MNRSRRLQPIVDLAGHEENQASRQMAATREKLEQQEKLLRDLEDYHAEYTSTKLMSHTGVADPVRLQDYRLFLDRLEHAIVRQHELIARLRADLDTDRDAWRQRRSHRKALDNVTGRYARAEAREMELREQQQTEEISALLRARRQAT